MNAGLCGGAQWALLGSLGALGAPGNRQALAPALVLVLQIAASRWICAPRKKAAMNTLRSTLSMLPLALLSGVVLFAALLAMPLTHAQAPVSPPASPPVPIAPQSTGTVMFISGGADEEEVTVIRSVAPQFNLRLTLSEGARGQYVVDIPVTITDAVGKTVFMLPNAGPLLSVRLPSGTYHVTARYNNQIKKQDVVLTALAGKDLSFNWQQLTPN